MGYTEIDDVEDILREANIEGRAVFCGLEDITGGNLVWKAFSLLKRITPTKQPVETYCTFGMPWYLIIVCPN